MRREERGREGEGERRGGGRGREVQGREEERR